MDIGPCRDFFVEQLGGHVTASDLVDDSLRVLHPKVADIAEGCKTGGLRFGRETRECFRVTGAHAAGPDDGDIHDAVRTDRCPRPCLRYWLLVFGIDHTISADGSR